MGSVIVTIEQLDGERVLILLGSSDMKDFALEYDTLSFSDSHSRKILSRLLTLACLKTGLSCADKKMLVEAVPQDGGCVILLTLKPKRRLYRVKRRQKCVCAVAENADSLMLAAANLGGRLPEAEVFLYRGRYVIIVDGYTSLGNMSALDEFAESFFIPLHNAAKVREHGKPLGRLGIIAEALKK